MKKIITFVVLFSTIMSSFAQEKVTNRNGKEITVNEPATTTTQGVVKLAGDLGGTADAPTVPGLALKAPLASPTFTGVPAGPTAAAGTNTTQLATTAFVTAASGTPFFKATTTNDVLNDKTTNFFTNRSVGIGTNNPLFNLDVVGGFALRSATGAMGSGYGMEFLTNANSPRIDWVANGAYIGQFSSNTTDFLLKNSLNNSGNIRFFTNTAGSGKERLTILNNGNIGIGTNAPSAPLAVQGVTGTGALKLIAPSVGAGDNWWMGFGHGTTSTDANDRARVGVEIANGGKGRLFFTTGNPGSQTRALFINEDQKVGIGTSTPGNKLEITHGTAGNSGLRFTNLTSSTAATTTSSKVLGLNASGDVVLTNVPGTQNIVDFSTATPTTSGVVFTPNTPADESVVYQSNVDNSMWTYNGTTYVTYTAPSSTAWYTAGTTNDAGSSKTSNIYRTGNVGIGINNPLTNLHIQNSTPAIQAANADAKVLRLSRPSTGGVKWDNIAQFNLGTYSNTVGSPIDAKSRLDLTLTNGGDNTTLSNVMTWQGNGNVGIGTTAPTSKLVVSGLNNPVSALGTAQTNAIFRVEGESNHSLDMGTLTASPFGSYVQSHNKGGATSLPLLLNPVGGNVGIGTSNPISKLEVNGAATNTTAYNAGLATAILFSNSNLAYTSASPTAFSLQGMKDGGTYTLAVQGTTSGTSSFIGKNPSLVDFVFKSVNNGSTIAGKQTLYTFIVMGTTVYVYMAAGF